LQGSFFKGLQVGHEDAGDQLIGVGGKAINQRAGPGKLPKCDFGARGYAGGGILNNVKVQQSGPISLLLNPGGQYIEG
jgi:hypothetical protein